MSRIARTRKAVVATLGTAATVAATIPQDSPAWRTAQVVLALATIAGVYQIRNAPAVTRGDVKQATPKPPARG